MGKFIISGFADEIAPELDKQMTVLKKLGIGFAELRGIDGKNVSDYTAEKMKTVKKFLGANYTVEASNGHVRDFPKSQFGIDVDNDFEPKYITIRGKGELLAKLRKEAKKADKIYLATDPDREGEAIAWHLAYLLGIPKDAICRVTFNEITKPANIAV